MTRFTFRAKLMREHRALLVHNMRLRHGDVVRVSGASFIAARLDTCIDCAWDIKLNDVITHAHWTRRNVSGFYAHVHCTPITDSEWLNDEDYVTMFSASDEYSRQSCTLHSEQVRYRILTPWGATRYACDRCLTKNGEELDTAGRIAVHSRAWREQNR